MRNLTFHRARIGGLEFEALMSVDGPYRTALGVSHLHWFGSVWYDRAQGEAARARAVPA